MNGKVVGKVQVIETEEVVANFFFPHGGSLGELLRRTNAAGAEAYRMDAGILAERLRDHAGGIGIVDHPRVGAQALHRVSEGQRHGNRSEGFHHAAGAGRFLPDEAHAQRDALILHARRISADAVLGNDEIRAGERRVPVRM